MECKIIGPWIDEQSLPSLKEAKEKLHKDAVALLRGQGVTKIDLRWRYVGNNTWNYYADGINGKTEFVGKVYSCY